MDRALDREILRLALPALGALLVEPLVSAVDTAFVGRLGAVPLAALGVTTALLGLFFVVFNFLAYATTPRVAYALGRGDHRLVRLRAREALWLSLVLGVLATLVLEVAAPWLVGAMGAGPEVFPAALGYLRLRALAGLAILVMTAAQGIYRGLQDTRTPFVVAVWVNLLNAVLDPVFIFLLGLGLQGAALASVLAQTLGAAWFFVLLLRVGAFGPFPGWQALLPYLRVGGEMFVRTLSLVGAITAATAFAARIGVVAVAAHQVLWQVWWFLAMGLDALAIAAQALVAKLRGASPEMARQAVRRLLFWGLLLGVLLVPLLAVSGRLILALFTPEPAVQKAALRVWPVVVLATPLNALVFVLDGIFMGLERFRLQAGVMVVAALTGLFLFFALSPGLGLLGLWLGMAGMNVVRAAGLLFYLWRERWA